MNSKIKILTAILVMGIILLPQCYVWGSPEEIAKIVLPTKTIDVHLPIKIKNVRYNENNASMEIKIEDNLRKPLLLHLSVETQIIPPELGKRQQAIFIYSNVYIGGRRGNPLAQKLPLGGNEEKTILKILQSWVGNNSKGELIKKIMVESGLNSKSKAEFYLGRVIDFIEILKGR
jgi:hypothetical protein